MRVEDKFPIDGVGTVATGIIENGVVTVGDEVELVATGGEKRIVKILGVEMFQKDTDRATKGDNVGLLLAELDEGEVSRGDVLQSQI
jgi:elongation factor Tu